jgi:hypothetical protein
MAQAGGIGLGLVGGWVVASVALPRGPVAVGGLLAALGAVVAVAGLVGGGDAAGWCVAGGIVGFVIRRGIPVALQRAQSAQRAQGEGGR